MQLGVDVDGVPELDARLDHAQRGLLDLPTWAGQLLETAPPMAVYPSPALRPRLWGTGDVWELPAGGWVAGRDGRVHLPDDVPDQLAHHVQELLDGH